jgi:hypothetical protein
LWTVGVFDLVFVDDQPERQEEGWDALKGEIRLGDYRETFLAALDPWARRDYQLHWIEAAQRLIRGSDRTAFLTSAFQFRWVMWREGTSVVAQEHLLGFGPRAREFDPREPFSGIRDRVSVNLDGVQISEWHLSLADIQDFLDRRSSAYVPA